MTHLKSAIGLALCIVLTAQDLPCAQNESPGVTELAKALAPQLVSRRTFRVATIDFADLQGHQTELGRYLADQLSVELVAIDGITVVDRANINAIMAEHKLTAAGLVDPANAKRLGQFAGVDALLVGSLVPIQDSVTLTVRAISTDSSVVVAAGRARFPLSDDFRKMLGMALEPPLAARTDSPNGSALGPVDVGSLRATVKSAEITRVDGLPYVKVALSLLNRRADAATAVSLNSRVATEENPRAANVIGAFATLRDSNGGVWASPPTFVTGIATVYCFETQSNEPYDWVRRITQVAPSNIVDYIKHGSAYDGTALRNVTQRLWGGSFSSIEPTGSLDIAIVFVPSDAIDRNGNRSMFSRSTSTQAPALADLSLELVLGSLPAGGLIQNSPDLALRSLIVRNVPITAKGR